MGIIRFDSTVAKRILRTPVSKDIPLEFSWDGPDILVVYNQKTLLTQQQHEMIIHTEQGYGKNMHYFDIGLYRNSILQTIYKYSDPEIGDATNWIPSSKYKQSQTKPPLLKRCVLSQLEEDASILYNDSAIEFGYEEAMNHFLEKTKGEVIIKVHPKLRKESIWYKMAIKHNVPIVEFDSIYLNDFCQVITWSSTAMIESTKTDLVQLAKGSIGTFVKARTPKNIDEATEIIAPTSELITSRQKRGKWLLEKFCHPRLQENRAVMSDPVVLKFMDEIRFILELNIQ